MRCSGFPSWNGCARSCSPPARNADMRGGGMTPELDIVIPVYNEGRNIVAVLAALRRAVATPARVLICYDHAEDDTLPAIRANPQAYAGLPVQFVRNRTGRGVHRA